VEEEIRLRRVASNPSKHVLHVTFEQHKKRIRVFNKIESFSKKTTTTVVLLRRIFTYYTRNKPFILSTIMLPLLRHTIISSGRTQHRTAATVVGTTTMRAHIVVALLSSSAIRATAFTPLGTTATTSMTTSQILQTSSAAAATKLNTRTMMTKSSALVDEQADQDQAILATLPQLCAERNIPLEKVKNARDLASAHNSPVLKGRVYRMGRLSDASASDIQVLLQDLDLHTLVDLRSPTELKDDANLERADIFESFTNIVWKENSKNDGCVRELSKGEYPVKKPFWSRTKKVAPVTSDKEYDDAITAELCDMGCEEPNSVPASEFDYKNRRERHFVSLMNEFKYVKGTLSKVRKRDIAKTILKAPGAAFSKRVRVSIKEPFLEEINGGGLPMLNELLLRFGAPGIKYVLELVADKNRHPITFYCTAGKDRTGMLAAIILALCGAKPEDIVEDYALSANVYAQMNDHQAMVGALSQRSLDPKTFLGAPPSVMKEILVAIENEYGSVAGYCTWIGFGPEMQEKLRKACME
jgi:protein tyrosine/serine phosphatase